MPNFVLKNLAAASAPDVLLILWINCNCRRQTRGARGFARAMSAAAADAVKRTSEEALAWLTAYRRDANQRRKGTSGGPPWTLQEDWQLVWDVMLCGQLATEVTIVDSSHTVRTEGMKSYRKDVLRRGGLRPLELRWQQMLRAGAGAPMPPGPAVRSTSDLSQSPSQSQWTKLTQWTRRTLAGRHSPLRAPSLSALTYPTLPQWSVPRSRPFPADRTTG